MIRSRPRLSRTADTRARRLAYGLYGVWAVISESLTKLVEEFGKLPGIGKKSAERLAYHILRIHKTEALALADAIRGVKENVRYCQTCYNLTEQDACEICRDARRDRGQICVVEQPRDLIALE